VSETEQPAYVCSHVFDGSKPVLLVSRDDGDWQFLCGGDHPQKELPMVVGLNHLFDNDPSLRSIEDLPVDWEAERDTVASTWQRRQIV